MDKDVLRYLADIAAVRANTQALLNVGRGVIDQKVLHQVGAKTAVLDRLFVDVLLSGKAPGVNVAATNVVIRDDDDVDYVAKLAEAKKSIADKRNKIVSVASVNNNTKTVTIDAPSDNDVVETRSFPAPDEQSAYERLLAKAEAEAAFAAAAASASATKKVVKKTRKKSSEKPSEEE
jgi:hypothetical protein